MRYVKYKREKESICNLCREIKPLSWDHVPPKGGINLTAVQIHRVFELITNPSEHSNFRISQNGVKYRTLCKECNELLGVEYDPTLNNFAIGVGRYLNSQLKFPEVIHHRLRPQRLLKAILGHLIATKVGIEDSKFDQLARKYVLDSTASLPDNINVFYWVYPYKSSVIIRELGKSTVEQNSQKLGIFQALKYFPIAYLCCEKEKYTGLDSFHSYRHYGLDEECEIKINLTRIEPENWPEFPEKSSFLYGGQSANNAIYSIPRQ